MTSRSEGWSLITVAFGMFMVGMSFGRSMQAPSIPKRADPPRPEQSRFGFDGGRVTCWARNETILPPATFAEMQRIADDRYNPDWFCLTVPTPSRDGR